MNVATQNLVLEAFRRWQCFNRHSDRDTNPRGYWVGLGCASHYKPGVKAGLFQCNSFFPQPRIIHWWDATPKLAAMLLNMKAAGVRVMNHEIDLSRVDWAKLAKVYN